MKGFNYFNNFSKIIKFESKYGGKKLIRHQPSTSEEAKCLGRKDAALANLADIDLDVFEDMLDDLKEYFNAGMELQIFWVMKETGWTREMVMESMMVSGHLHGFPEIDYDKADPFDLYNWINDLKAINDVLANVTYLREKIDSDRNSNE